MGLVACFVVRELAVIHRQSILRLIPIGGVTNSAAVADGAISCKCAVGQGQISCPDAAALSPGVVIREGYLRCSQLRIVTGITAGTQTAAGTCRLVLCEGAAGDGYFRSVAKAGAAAGCGGVLRKGAVLQKQVVCVIVIGTQAAAVGSRMVAAEGHILQG